MRRFIIIFVVLSLLFLAWLEFSWGQNNFTPGIILVKFHREITAERVDEINGRLGTSILERYDFGGQPYFYAIKVPAGREEQIAGDYRKAPEVSSASPEYIRH